MAASRPPRSAPVCPPETILRSSAEPIDERYHRADRDGAAAVEAIRPVAPAAHAADQEVVVLGVAGRLEDPQRAHGAVASEAHLHAGRGPLAPAARHLGADAVGG